VHRPYQQILDQSERQSRIAHASGSQDGDQADVGSLKLQPEQGQLLLPANEGSGRRRDIVPGTNRCIADLFIEGVRLGKHEIMADTDIENTPRKNRHIPGLIGCGYKLQVDG